MSCDCGCKNPVAVVPPIVKFVRESTDTGNGCALKQPFETLEALSFVPQAVDATQSLKVCAASNYIIGTCVLLIDAAGHTQVQRVTGHSGTDTLLLTAYTNAYSDTTTTLTAPIYAQPLGICPPDTTSVEECFRLNARTDDAFIMPATVDDGGSAVAVTFTESVSLPLGADVFIEGAGWMEVAEPPVGEFVECSATHYFLNLGTDGNETPGQTVPGNGYLIIGRAPKNEVTLAAVQGTPKVEVGSMAGAGTYSNTSTPFVIPWPACVMVSCLMGLDATGATTGTDFQYMVQYSTDSGGTWTDWIPAYMAGIMETRSNDANPTTVVRSAALAAGTYIFRYKTLTASGSPTYPLVLALELHILAIRTSISM